MNQSLNSNSTARCSAGRVWLLTCVIIAACGSAAIGAEQSTWWKGNLHTHSLWSDGDDYPEMIVDWYKQQGYHFLALSDHNILAQGNKWIHATTNKGGAVALDKYVKRFGANWVELRETNGARQVRLKTLAEYRNQFEAPGTFL